MEIKTTEVLVKLIEDLFAANPKATRADIRRVTGASSGRLKTLADEGRFVWPAPVPKSRRHLYSNQNEWRKFRLYGSLEGKKNVTG